MEFYQYQPQPQPPLNDPPMKVKVAVNFINHMRNSPPLGAFGGAMAMMGPFDDGDDWKEPEKVEPLTHHEEQAYNAACFVMWGYFTGEMDYGPKKPDEDPEVVTPPANSIAASKKKFGEPIFDPTANNGWNSPGL